MSPASSLSSPRTTAPDRRTETSASRTSHSTTRDMAWESLGRKMSDRAGILPFESLVEHCSSPTRNDPRMQDHLRQSLDVTFGGPSVILEHVSEKAAKARVLAASDGCYEAARASALSGVPQSTVYWWARHGIVVPSVSPTREKLWSYADLMALRIVSWLRHEKQEELPASPMSRVRQALALLADIGLDLWDPDSTAPCPLLVDGRGFIYVRHGNMVLDGSGQPALLPAEVLELTAPFTDAGLAGPDLVRPRPHLRIMPSKVSGEPHVEHTRITTLTLAALAGRGYSVKRIAEMYDEPEDVVKEALDLEQQLAAGRPVAA
jgi:uncharacterized protein (DUF433 family)